MLAEEVGDSKTQDVDGDLKGVATLLSLVSPGARREEVVAREVEAWSKKPQSEVSEVPGTQQPLVAYIQMRKLRTL